MNQKSNSLHPIFHIDVTQGSSEPLLGSQESTSQIAALLHQLVEGQDRQNELLEEIVDQLQSGQRQRISELNQWKDANPQLARRCRAAAEALSQVQTEFLQNLTVDIGDNFEAMIDSDFVLNEFVDRYGPRLAHLNGVLQMLSQLSMFNGSQETTR